MSIQDALAGGYGGPSEPIPGYRLIERIGRGGYGEVWKALAPGGVSKAVKLIYGDDPSRSVTELRALNRVKDVRHPFLLSIERIEQREGLLAIVTELGDRNLQQHFQACLAKGLPGIPQADLLGMLRDVADVLDYIYQEHALQHLDIKPANLLLFGRRLKVADFGLVKNIYERSASLVHGLTPTYAAPEIFEGQPTRTSDQYSLAILYQEMLTGILPFNGNTAARLATQHLRETPDLRPLPVAQQPIIARALSKDPQQRFPTCMELVEELCIAARRAPAKEPAREDLPLARELLKSAQPAPAEPATTPESGARVPRPTQPHDGEDTQVHTGDAGQAAETRPTIVIGIGGTAAKVLQRLRLRIADRLGSVESLTSFKMLLIDIDQDTLNEVNRDQRAWSELETVPTPLRSSAEYREQGHLHRRWLSRRWLFNVPRNLRTEGLRPLGRLALMSNAGKVLTALRSAIMQVTSSRPDAAGSGSAQRPPRILLITSISGGTGSGMILDLAYAARHELRSAGFTEGSVDGVLLHSTPVGTGRDKSVLNAIATLQELEHYSAPGSYYPGEPLLQTPPFHGNNQTFSSTQLMDCGEGADTSSWLRAIDNVAEHVYCRVLTAADPAGGQGAAKSPGAGPTLDVVQVRQIGGYSGSFVDDLTRQLCVDVIDGWCGVPVQTVAGERRTTSAATLLLNVMENNKSAKYQQLAAEAETQLLSSGVDIEQLLTNAREMLHQELGMGQRQYLHSLFAEAQRAVGEGEKPDQEIAGLVIALQDRAIGLDFGERLEDHSRNTLFDLLHSRLASQAMQIAARFTDWVNHLIDNPDAGVDAARHAAEAGRNSIRDLIGVLGKEIRELQKRQTNSRIALTAPAAPGDAPRSGRGWLLRRGNAREGLAERLVEHGLSSFEELLYLLVQWQLRAIEAHASAAIDQIICMWQELKHLGKQIGSEDLSSSPADCGQPTNYEIALRKLLLDHRSRLIRELRSRVEHDVLVGSQKLQRLLQQRGSYDQVLGVPLRRLARQVVLQSMQQVLIILLQQHAQTAGNEAIDLDAALSEILSEPWTLTSGERQRAVLVAPKAVSLPTFRSQTSRALPSIPVVSAQTNSIAVCRECRDVAIPGLIQAIAHGQTALVAVAANLHARIDVEWHAPPVLTSASTTPDAAPAVWSDVPQTVPLQ